MIVSLLLLASISSSSELILGKLTDCYFWEIILCSLDFHRLETAMVWWVIMGGGGGLPTCLIRPGQLSWSVWFGSLLELVVGKVPTFQWSGGLPAACADFSLRAAWQQVRRFLRIKLTAVLAHSLPNNPPLSRLFPFNNQLSIIRERLARRTSTVGWISSWRKNECSII